MRFSLLIASVIGWCSLVFATSNNLTDAVTWDKYSLSINGSRVFIKLVDPVASSASRLCKL